MSKVICHEEKCSGCLACVLACMDQQYDAAQENALSPRILEKKIYSSGRVGYVTRSCLHCDPAPCMEVCPMQVFARSENGFVVVAQREKCVGCRRCAASCPHDVPRFDEENKVVKCDGCAVRVACGLEPACIRACNTGALELVP